METFAGWSSSFSRFARKLRISDRIISSQSRLLDQDGKIVGVTKVLLRANHVLHKLVKLVHIDVHEELGGEIAERETDAGRRGKAADHLFQQPDDALVCNVGFHNFNEYRMVDACEELADVALKYPAGACVILTHGISERPETVHRSVCPLVVAAGERVGDKGFVEERIELAVYRVVDKSVAHARFVNIARLRIGYFERLIAAMFVCPVGQIDVK